MSFFMNFIVPYNIWKNFDWEKWAPCKKISIYCTHLYLLIMNLLYKEYWGGIWYIDLNLSLVINDQLVQEAMLPGLRCLKQDMAAVAPEREEVVSSIIKDYEAKVEGSR